MGRCNPITKNCTRTPWWRSAIGVDWIGGSGGGGEEPATIGEIYNQSTWANLNDFTAFGTSGASIVSNKIQFTGGAGTTANGMTLARKSLLEKCVFQTTFIINSTVSSTSQGPGFEFRSINAWTNQKHSILCRFNMTNDATAGGTVRILSSVNQSTYTLLINSAKLAISQNDVIRVTLTRSYFTFTALAENITTGLSVSCSYTYDAASATTLPNTYRYGLMNVGGTWTVQSINITSVENKDVDIVCIGDSKIAGRQANVYTARFADLLKTDYSVVTLGGPSDRTVEIVQILDEITEINATNIIFCIGRNDIASGVASGTWQANLDLLESTFSDKNIIFLTIEPDSQDQSALVSYIQGKPWQYIRAENITISADNVHPNAIGHSELHAEIIASNLLV